MKISRKITLTIVLTLLLLLGVGYVGLHYVVGNKFGELERLSVERNRERVRAVVQAELDQLTILGQDWSEWDDTYAYMASRDPAYLAANLNARTFETLAVDLVALYDADKRPQVAFAYHGGKLLAQTPDELAPLTDYLVRYGSLKPNGGIWLDGERYYLLAATQILTSEGRGRAAAPCCCSRLSTPGWFISCKSTPICRSRFSVRSSWPPAWGSPPWPGSGPMTA